MGLFDKFRSEQAVTETPANEMVNDVPVNNMIPVIALRGMTIIPGTVIHFDLSRQISITSVEKAMSADQKIFLVTQKDPDTKNPGLESLYEYGTYADIKQVIKLPNDIVRVMVEGLYRGKLIKLDDSNESYLRGEIEIIKDDILTFASDEAREKAMVRELRAVFTEYCTYYPKVGKAFSRQLEENNSIFKLIDEIVANIPISYEKKQEVLSAKDIQSRYKLITGILNEEIEISKIRSEIQQGVKSQVEKNQKDYVLREQMQYIRKELGDNQDLDQDADEFLNKTMELEASDEVKDRIQKEIRRYRLLSQTSTESSVLRGYIETLLEMPWDKMQEEKCDLKEAERILNEDHYGLEKVKERILEFLAVRSLTEKGESPIICLVGPPGTGKTSIARSIATALNKKYVRVCLGGVRDEAEIRGHRRTYVSALPGRIAEGIKNAGVKNPLMLLDEIDKAGSDHRGDTSSALLEVLDSEQNGHFRDHYIEIPIDLSEVLFIATANDINEIPRPLYDRMEIVEVSGYTENEKLHIAKEHLVEKCFKKNGLKKSQLSISDGALKALIRGYTKEAGVRSLERRINEICRKSARKILEGDAKEISVTGKNLEKLLGKVKYTVDMANDEDQVGIVRGLAWTQVGGDTLEIEVNILPGKGEVSLTGKLGDVMKESAMTGLSYIRSIVGDYGIKSEYFRENDFHLHIPEGATPKDGPSAGITMATALFSAITEIPVRCDVAMTGEITLRGRVLPIGGLKEKLLAAKNAGIKKVLVPDKNKKDVEEISAEITDGLKLVFVSSMEQVLKEALSKDADKIKRKKKA